MNPYYHSFVPGFNWVYLWAPLLLAFVAFIGFRLGARIKMECRMRVDSVRGEMQYSACVADKCGVLRIRVVSDTVDKVIGFISGVIVGILLCTECFNGIIQYFNNTLSASDSPIWSVFMATVAILALAGIYGVIATGIFYAAKKRKVQTVKEKYGMRYRIKVFKRRTATEVFEKFRHEWLIAKYNREGGQSYARATTSRVDL